jgi:hypothetical protein
MEVSGQFHVSAALYTGKRPPVPVARKLGRPQSRSGRCGGERNLIIGNDENRKWNSCQFINVLTSETTQKAVFLA